MTMTATGPERRGPERPGPDYPPEWDLEPDDDGWQGPAFDPARRPLHARPEVGDPDDDDELTAEQTAWLAWLEQRVRDV